MLECLSERELTRKHPDMYPYFDLESYIDNVRRKFAAEVYQVYGSRLSLRVAEKSYYVDYNPDCIPIGIQVYYFYIPSESSE